MCFPHVGCEQQLVRLSCRLLDKLAPLVAQAGAAYRCILFAGFGVCASASILPSASSSARDGLGQREPARKLRRAHAEMRAPPGTHRVVAQRMARSAWRKRVTFWVKRSRLRDSRLG
mmetsp:Transcript_6868/g.18388  ORF Transcript_6868/g.18388 Transcript_6868/m.18388 type:complete len:117 (-) Transcript_6868:713-1063(-)